MKGTIPPGVSVPLHSHPDPESFYVLSGSAQTLLEQGNRLEWVDVKAADFIHIPGGAKHAHRNVSDQPVVELITTTPTLGQFFEEIGKPRTAEGTVGRAHERQSSRARAHFRQVSLLARQPGGECGGRTRGAMNLNR
jgi:oxalate decarboxylase/phosphoglucose isomerase-like protein (cupin superfamily)